MNSSGQDVDSIYNFIKTHDADSSYIILEDKNKDGIIDKVIYIDYYPKTVLSLSSLDTDYDGYFETTTKRLSYENSLIDIGVFDNLDDSSQLLKNFPIGKYKTK